MPTVRGLRMRSDFPKKKRCVDYLLNRNLVANLSGVPLRECIWLNLDLVKARVRLIYK